MNRYGVDGGTVVARGLWSLLLVAAAGAAEPAPPAPDRVILFTIDGLAVEAPRRLQMPNLNRLAQAGCYYQAMHLPLPGHPKNDPRYPWSCSMPNPMLLSGTPFIGVDGIRDALIQHRFDKERTAFVVNARSYVDVSGGFGAYVSKPGQPDAWVIEEAKEILLRSKPAFMRVHLQRAGIEGEKVSKESYADRPYYRNIWHPESPYREACQSADRLLGKFVSWLKEQNLWEGTVLFICGDHGQADEGWHEPYAPASSVTPLIIVGPGLCAGRTFPHCEIFDVAPTIAALTGREAPARSIGRVLGEAMDARRPGPEGPGRVEQLNCALRTAHALPAERQEALKEAGFLTIDELARWHTTEAGADFEAFVSRQRRLLEVHRSKL